MTGILQIIVAVILGASVNINSQTILAFPEAEGFGAETIGGRGGRIIEVTNLNESGDGSLRAAVEASGPRIVVFRVSGYIDLTSPIRLTNPYITIAGQTAPGDGICLRMKPGNSEGIGGLIYVPNSADNLHDVIIRYLKFRQGWSLTYKGHGNRPHNIYFRRGYNVIIDHVSSQWTRDNLLSVSLGSSAVAADSMYNFSIQKCLFGESEDGHSTGMNIQGTSNTDRGTCFYTGKWVKNISIHRNLFVSTDHRNPRVSVQNVRVINNVTYNWGNRAGSTTRNVKVDFINNYFKAGPMTTDKLYYQRLFHEPWNYSCVYTSEPASIYLHGNIMTPHFNPPSDPYDFFVMKGTLLPLEDKYRRFESLAPAPIQVPILSIEATYDSVLSDVGSNARLNENGSFVSNIINDTVDTRMINNVKNGTGLDHELLESDWNSGLVSFPVMGTDGLYADTDHDGMADTWEINSFGNLTTAQYDDANKTDSDSDGYYDLDEFLNGSDPKVPVKVEPKNKILDSFMLSQNYPNPFNPTTVINFRIPKASNVELSVYNILGQKVSTLLKKELSAGSYKYSFDGSDLKSGIYFYRLTSDGYSVVKKMMLVK